MTQKPRSPEAGGAPPIDWLHQELRRRAEEVKFLRDAVFPYPVQRRRYVRASGPPGPEQAVIVAVFGPEPRTCQFYVTQPFRLIGGKLFAGLQPDPESFPRGGPHRLYLCAGPEEEIETPIVLRTAGEFQLLFELEPELIERWNEVTDWNSPESIPFGLALRPIEDAKV